VDPQLINYFNLDQQNGVLSIANDRTLDYEGDKNIFRVQVKVADSSQLPLFGTAQVIVHILDENEQPVFDNTVRYISENSLKYTKVGSKLEGTDPDIYSRQRLAYEIVDGNSEGIFKVIDCDGQLEVLKDKWGKDDSLNGFTLDYERSQKYKLKIRVTDDGKPSPKFAEAFVEIRVEDINEPPRFPDMVASTRLMEENGLRKNDLATVNISGWAGKGNRSIIHLTSTQSKIELNPQTPGYAIIESVPLDLSDKGVSLLIGHQPILHAEGIQFQLDDKAMVYLAIDPRNMICTTGNCGECTSSCPLDDMWVNTGRFMKINQRENVLEFPIFSKRFSNLNEIQTIQLAEGPAAINGKSVIVAMIGPYVESAGDDYCRNGLGVSTGKLLPVTSLTSNIDGSLISDNRRAGWFLGGLTGKASIADGKSFFQVDLLTEFSVSGIEIQGIGNRGIGNFRVDISLDGKTFSSITTRLGGPVAYFTGSLTDGLVSSRFYMRFQARFVRIIPTQCLQTCVASFELFGGPVEKCQEIMGLALSGGAVAAHDPDGLTNKDWGTLTYTIIGGDVGGAFCLPNPHVGEIHVCNPLALDCETRSRVVLSLSVRDNGFPPLQDTISVTIKISDLNEAPFLNNVEREVIENAIVDTKIGLPVRAVDVDLDDARQIKYELVGGVGMGKFVINANSGQISVSVDGSQKGALNYEETQRYVLRVKATDSMGLSHVGEVTISIIDVNEAPEFPDTERYINETSKVGTAVGNVLLSSDIDSGRFGIPTYAIIKQYRCHIENPSSCQLVAPGPFSVEPVTGQLTVINELNLNGHTNFNFEDNIFYRIKTSATDVGSLKDFAWVTIHIIDVNEPPIFHKLKSREQDKFFNSTSTVLIQNFNMAEMVRGSKIEENSVVGTYVGSVMADPIDYDDGITYSIVAGDKFGNFNILNDGKIYIKKATIDFESSSLYELTIQAKDEEGLRASTSYVVVVVDVNEVPVFQSTFSGRILENAKSGTSVGTPVQAFDEDTLVQSIPLNMWENVETSQCMMQWGINPFTRASERKRISIDLGTPKSNGWVSDLTHTLTIVSSNNIYADELRGKPTSSILMRNFNEYGCWKFNKHHFSSVESNTVVKNILGKPSHQRVDPIRDCHKAVTLLGSNMFAIGQNGLCLIGGTNSSICYNNPASNCYLKDLQSSECTEGVGSQSSVAIYGVIRPPKLSRSCSHILMVYPTASSGKYTIQPDPTSDPVETYCDMVSDGGGWTLVAAGVDSILHGQVWKKRGLLTNKFEKSFITKSAVDIINLGSETSISWSASKHNIRDIASYDKAVKARMDNIDIFHGDLTIEQMKCNDHMYVEVNISCIVGDCNLPDSMFTRKKSMGANLGNAYGFTYSDSKSELCDIHVNKLGSSSILMSATGNKNSYGVRDVFGNVERPGIMSLWSRSPNIVTKLGFTKVPGNGKCVSRESRGGQKNFNIWR